MRINKLFVFVFVALMVMSFASAAQESLGTFKQNDCIALRQICSNCTYNNITSVMLPDSTTQLNNVGMTKVGTEYNYTFCNTSQLGNYIVNGLGNLDGTATVWNYDFEITVTGNEGIGAGQGIGLFGALIVILVIVVFFFVMYSASLNIAVKICFMGLAIIFMVVAILFSILYLSQILGNYSDIVEGMSTLWFIVKMFVGLLITALCIFAIWFTYNSWMKYRGFRD